MRYYVDISTDQFESIRDHIRSELELSSDYLAGLSGRKDFPFLEEGEELKLYHPGQPAEALRVEVGRILPEDGSGTVRMEVCLKEWMMGLPQEEEEPEEDEFLFW